MIYAKNYVTSRQLQELTAPISTLSNGMKAIEHAVLVHTIEKAAKKLNWTILQRRNMLLGLDLVSVIDIQIKGIAIGSIAFFNSYTGHNALKATTGAYNFGHPAWGFVLDMYQASRRTYDFGLDTWINYILEWAAGSLEENHSKVQQMEKTRLTQAQVDHIIMEASRGSRLHKLSWTALRKVHDNYHEAKGTTAYDLAVAFAKVASTVSPVLQFHAGYRFNQLLLPRKKTRKIA